MIKIGGVTVYHAGDTCLFSDMKLIAERNPIDVALLPIGGHYTMDRHDAVVAAEFVGAGTVIPMHYDTFPPIETDAERLQGGGRVEDLLEGRRARARGVALGLELGRMEAKEAATSGTQSRTEREDFQATATRR